MSAPIAVIDTGICNLRSVTKALEAAGARPIVVRTPQEVDSCGAEGLVLPGVGALRDCVLSLLTSGLDATVRRWISLDRPFLGVCLGMQALFDESEEGGVKGLGVFPGRVVRFRLDPPLKVPHMGWNTVSFLQRGPGGPRRRGGDLLLRPQLPLRPGGQEPRPRRVRLRAALRRGDSPGPHVCDPVPP
jgi:glutamine amidotransferase